METLTLAFDSVEALEEELEKNLLKGGCFVAGASGFAANDNCTLRLDHPAGGEPMELSARVVWVAGSDGVGLQFEDFGPDLKDALRAFAARTATAADDGDGATAAPEHQTVQQRLRGLTQAEALKVARRGRLDERVALERIYGKAVWAALLGNPQLTVAEVARLARMHTMPRPLLEQIGNNRAWLQNAQVRRAMLSNPRVAKDVIRKILRITPKPELKLIPKQTAYPLAVRQEAKRQLIL